MVDQPDPRTNGPRGFFPCRVNEVTIEIAGLIALGVLISSLMIYPSLKELYEIKNFDLERPSRLFKNYMQEDVDPCDDFYRFACGNFLKESEQRAKTNSTVRHMQELASLALKEKLSEPIGSWDSVVLRKLKTFYSMCMDEGKIIEEGKEPILMLLRDVGGWPLIEEGTYNRNETWENVVERVNRAGFESFFPFRASFDNDPKNSSKHAIKLVQLLSDDWEESHYILGDRIQHVANWLGPRFRVSFEDIGKIIDFESALFKITNPAHIAENRTHTVASLVDQYPQISWNKFFEIVFMDTNVKVTSNDTVTLDDDSYVSRVSDLLRNTSIETVTNYIVWRVVDEVTEFTPLYFGHTRDDFCLRTLSDRAPLAMGYVYINNVFDQKIKETVQPIVSNIRSEAYSYINELQWIDSHTKKSILERLTNLKMTIGSSDGHLGMKFIRKIMKGWNVERSSPILLNYRNLLELDRRTRLNKLTMTQQEVELTIPIKHSTTADAGESVATGAVHIFAALLQRPFVAHDQPMYLNYGGIGFIIGHEITHGLELLSTCQNKTCESYDGYQSMRECTERIYDRYVIKQLHQTLSGGSRILEENVGDIMGLAFVYRAYEKFTIGRSFSEPPLPGLNLTPRQMFWLNAATSFCSHRNDVELAHFMHTDPHSPEEARINVAFANMKEFSRDFGCPDDSQMNPVERCTF